MKPSDFYTRAVGNQGAKMELMRPDGTFSKDDFLIVRSIDCDEYRAAREASYRVAIDAAQLEDKELGKKIVEDSKLNLYVSLVASWSFEDEITPEALKEFFIESPNNATLVDKFASDRANFFPKRPQN